MKQLGPFAAIVCLLLIAGIVACSGGVSKSKYEELQRSYDSLIDANSTLQHDYDSLRNSSNELQQSHDALTSENDSLRADYQALQSAYNSLRDSHYEQYSELIIVRQQLEDALAEAESLKEQLDVYRSSGIGAYAGVQPPYLKSPSAEIDLKNNPIAVNPTWSQLKKLILSDSTDKKTYIENSYTCGNYAETVHNNAEAAGIKAALVAVEFQEGIPHALNVFNTTDKGLVYIDCTGAKQGSTASSADKVAYVKIGQDLGCIDLNANPEFTYEYYEEWELAYESFEARLKAFNAEIEAYNAEIEGKIFYIGTPEYVRITQWEDELNQESEALNELEAQFKTYWEPMGIVKSIGIYW